MGFVLGLVGLEGLKVEKLAFVMGCLNATHHAPKKKSIVFLPAYSNRGLKKPFCRNV